MVNGNYPGAPYYYPDMAEFVANDGYSCSSFPADLSSYAATTPILAILRASTYSSSVNTRATLTFSFTASRTCPPAPPPPQPPASPPPPSPAVATSDGTFYPAPSYCTAITQTAPASSPNPVSAGSCQVRCDRSNRAKCRRQVDCFGSVAVASYVHAAGRRLLLPAALPPATPGSHARSRQPCARTATRRHPASCRKTERVPSSRCCPPVQYCAAAPSAPYPWTATPLAPVSSAPGNVTSFAAALARLSTSGAAVVAFIIAAVVVI